MLILIDQDGVLADFAGCFEAAWKAAGHTHPVVPLSQRRSFYMRDEYPVELRQSVEAIYTAPGFFRELPAISGAVEAMHDMLALGHEVGICTSPLNQYRHCVTEKYEWVERHLGANFVSRIILLKDKTLVRGDVLIDDKPYNRHVTGTRMTWANWRDVLLPSG